MRAGHKKVRNKQEKGDSLLAENISTGIVVPEN